MEAEVEPGLAQASPVTDLLPGVAPLDAFIDPHAFGALVRPDGKAVRIGAEGIQVDVRALPEESYGAALQYFTGSR